MSSAHISVIIPTRNRLGFLREAVASVQAQSLRDWELVVVDDCSEDGTWQWLRSLEDGRIRPLRMERHRERSTTRNAGLTAARGEYVFFLDDDDWLLPDALKHLRGAFRRHSNAVATIGSCRYYQEGRDLWRGRLHPRFRRVRDIWLDVLYGWTPLQGQFLVRRSALIEVGGFKEYLHLNEDREIWLRLSRLGPVALIPEPVFVYRTHPHQSERQGAAAVWAQARREACASLGPREMERFQRSLAASHSISACVRSFRAGAYPRACALWFRAMRRAPWLLRSPILGGHLLGVGARCLVSVVVRRQGVETLRRIKKAVPRAATHLRRVPATALPAHESPRTPAGASAPRISVILPTRNRLRFLREAVASVQSQSFRDWELIVVDDACENGTGRWLGTLDDPRIRPLRMEQHRERSAARNAGLAAARGEYVLFLDDDDWLAQDALMLLEQAAAREPETVAACGGCVYVRPDTPHLQKRTQPSRRVVQDVWPDLLFGWFPIPAQMLIRRRAILQAGGWDETLSLCEDYEICLRLARLGQFILIPQVVLGYRIHGNQTPRAGAQVLTQTLALKAVKGLEAAEVQRANRSIRSRRLVDAAGHAYTRERYGLALSLLRRGFRYAPWILRSPINRGDLIGLSGRCLTGLVLGQRSMARLRGAKRACASVLRRRAPFRGSQSELFP